METEPEEDMCVVLVHGFFRTRRDMTFLHRGLERRGYRVISVELPITRGTIADGVAALELHLEQEQLRGKRIAFVAHSMGGLVVRALIARKLRNPTRQHHSAPFNISHCVFIGTPHRGSLLADMALHIPGLGRWFKALPDLRTRPGGEWSAPLLHPVEGRDTDPDTRIRIGVIAGTSASILPGRFLISGNNDGMVSCASAVSTDADAVMLTPFNHVTIHKHSVTLKAIIHFFNCGDFPQED
ncbi:MAG: alpha/beta fold hydrolase [Geobacteraceae bacterium]|nr:alpha/beta fold hydrolase [Geobacteraceae bacterium]